MVEAKEKEEIVSKALTHGEFIAKMKRHKLIYEAWKKDVTQSWATLATSFDLKLPVHALQALRYYQRHESVPTCELLANIPHVTAIRCSHLVPFTSKEDMRKALITKFSASIGISKPYPKEFHKRLIKILLIASGLEWFLKDGKYWAHWKHDKELA